MNVPALITLDDISKSLAKTADRGKFAREKILVYVRQEFKIFSFKNSNWPAFGNNPARKNANKRLKESSVLPLFWLPKKFDASVFYAAS